MLASVVGSLLVWRDRDRENLFAKAIGEALGCNVDSDDAIWLASELRAKLETYL